jgi:hypothetical protein
MAVGDFESRKCKARAAMEFAKFDKKFGGG